MARKPKVETPAAEPEIVAIKGFGTNMQCRGYQFEVGKTYEHDGLVEVCESGFHAIEGYPLEVFDHYPPGSSVYAEVKISGAISRKNDGDSKIAAGRLTVVVAAPMPDLVARAIKWIVGNAKHADTQHAEGYRSVASSTGDQSAASSTGDRSAASSTGDQSAASSTGDRSAASSTGYRSAASSTGDQSAASSTGYQSAASSTGNQSAAVSSGEDGRVMGAKGCALFLVYRDPRTGDIKHAWAGIAGEDGIKPMTWYHLGSDGKPMEFAP